MMPKKAQEKRVEKLALSGKLRLAMITFGLIIFSTIQVDAQWNISPVAGVEFALPRYETFNERTWPPPPGRTSFIKIIDNPQTTVHLGLDIDRKISEKWSLFANVSTMRYKFYFRTDAHPPMHEFTSGNRGRFNNIRTVLGTRYAVHENIRLGFGISFDYSYNFRYHDEDGERLDTNREYYITRDLGMNFNGTYHIGSFAFGIQINMGLIPLYSSDRKQIMEDKRELEPLSSIIATVGYRFEL